MSAMQGNAEACYALWELLGDEGETWLEEAALRQHQQALGKISQRRARSAARTTR